jgi:hypothetical protein
MSRIDSRLYAAAETAIRAAVERQHAELHGGPDDHDTISHLEHAADWLYAAAKSIEMQTGTRRQQAQAFLMIGVQAITCVAILLTVPDPAEPMVLALTFGGTTVLAQLVNDVAVTIADRHTARALAACGTTDPQNVPETIADLRSQIVAVAADLEPIRHDSHLRAGQQIDSALAWLD